MKKLDEGAPVVVGIGITKMRRRAEGGIWEVEPDSANVAPPC